jgi:putative transposase
VESRKTYGSPRIWLDLRDWGYTCSVHRVARLMRQAGIQGRARPRKLPVDSGERPVSAVAPNVLDRQFSAEAPNRRWLADFTYVPTGEGWLFVAVVLDLC